MTAPRQYHYVPVALALAGLLIGQAAAQETAEAPKSSFRQFMERDYLLGDWCGVRTWFSQHGVDFEFMYAASVPDNLSGGFRRGAVYQGGLLGDMTVDSEKLAGYPGGTLNVSGLWLNGEKPFSTDAKGNPVYVGDLNKVNLLDFPNALRLWELWYQQRFFDNKLSVKAGELSIDRDFVLPELYNSLGQFTLLNQTFFYPTLLFDVYDIPGLTVQHHGLASTHNAAPGAVVRYEPVPQVHVQAGVYGGNPDSTYHGTRFPLSEAEGALAYFELGYHLNQRTNDTGLPGAYKVGAFYHTGTFSDIYSGVTSAALAQFGLPAPAAGTRSTDYGWYLLAEQQIFFEKDKSDPAKQGLLGFFRLAGAPADRNLTEFEVDGGLIYKGLIPTRDWDTIAVAASYLEMSHDIKDAQRDLNSLAASFGAPAPFAALADYEGVIEASYKAQMAAWWTLQVSLQRVFHPGGSGALPNATVLIFQTTVRF